jgi:hypothetical protein
MVSGCVAGTHPFKSRRPDRVRGSPIPARKELIPDLTPIRPTFTLALELSTGFTHASAALRAHAIQNAGHHIGTRLGCTYSDEAHTHLRITRTFDASDAFPVPKLQSDVNTGK